MSVLATSLAGELENGDDREQRPSSILPSPPKKQKISEKNKVIAASTGAVVTSLTSFWDAVFKIVGNEGLAALWRGTAPALAMSVPGQVVYMVGYDWGRRTAFAHAPAWAYVESDSVNPLKDAAHLSSSYTTAVSLIGGSFSRTVVAALVSPVELLRTRLQSSSSSIDIITLARTLHAEGGWISAYRGLPPTLWRDVPFSGIYWAGYEAIKRAMTGGKGMGEATEGQGISGEFGVAFVSGAGSGMIAATATNPFDVVKTRRQALSLPSSSSTPPSSSPSTQEAAAAETRTFKIIADIVRKEGWPALMKGLTPRLAKVGPACGIMVGCYEGLGKWLD